VNKLDLTDVQTDAARTDKDDVAKCLNKAQIATTYVLIVNSTSGSTGEAPTIRCHVTRDNRTGGITCASLRCYVIAGINADHSCISGGVLG